MQSLHHEFLPAPGPKSRCLWIMLHGLGDSIEGYRWLPEAMRLPWMNYLLVNAPDEYYGGYSWYNFAGQSSDMISGVERSRKLLLPTPRYPTRAAVSHRANHPPADFPRACLS